MAVHAVDASVQPTAHEPLPKRRVARVEHRVPLGIPGEQIRVLLEAVGEVLLAEPLEDVGVGRVCLLDELFRRLYVLLLTPMNGDLRLGDRDRLVRHGAALVTGCGWAAIWGHRSPHLSSRFGVVSTEGDGPPRHARPGPSKPAALPSPSGASPAASFSRRSSWSPPRTTPTRRRPPWQGPSNRRP